jgi:Uma2 family endonuclease
VVVDVLVAPWAEVVPWPYSDRLPTVAEFGALRDDGWQYELVEGQLVRMPPPKGRHGFLESRIDRALGDYVIAHALGRVYVGDTGFDLTLPGETKPTVLGADVAFLRAERVPPDDRDDEYITGPPDLAVEIASPSQHRPDMGAKAWRWLQRGTRLVWVVWPKRREVDVWTPGAEIPETLGSGDTLVGADILPGFTFALADLFGLDRTKS